MLSAGKTGRGQICSQLSARGSQDDGLTAEEESEDFKGRLSRVSTISCVNSNVDDIIRVQYCNKSRYVRTTRY